MGLALGDYQHNGFPSIVISHFSDEYAAVFENLGQMNFSDVSYPSGIALSTTHYGERTCLSASRFWRGGRRYQEPALLFLNQGNRKFKDVSKLVGPAIQVPRVSRGVAVGDLFNDGKTDIVIENLKGEPTILQAQGGPANHWVGFELAGTKSNHLALNARVKVIAGDLVQTGEVRSGGSYLSQNDLRLHFGLGAKQNVDKLEIFWPTGKTETLKNLSADHIYAIKEGTGIVSAEAVRPGPASH